MDNTCPKCGKRLAVGADVSRLHCPLCSTTLHRRSDGSFAVPPPSPKDYSEEAKSGPDSAIRSRTEQKSGAQWRAKLGHAYKAQATAYQESFRPIRNAGFVLIVIAVAMFVAGAWGVWRIFAEADIANWDYRDFRIVGLLRYPLVYLIVVWFAPALISFVAGVHAVVTANLIGSLSRHFEVLAGNAAMDSSETRSLSELLFQRGVASERDVINAVSSHEANEHSKLIEQLAALPGPWRHGSRS